MTHTEGWFAFDVVAVTSKPFIYFSGQFLEETDDIRGQVICVKWVLRQNKFAAKLNVFLKSRAMLKRLPENAD